MQFHNSLKRGPIIGIIAVIAFCFLIFSPVSRSSGAEPVLADNDQILLNLPVDKPVESTLGVPVRIVIPIINVDTAIEQVGLTADGAMDVPKNITNAGWFDLGTRPGGIGSAVIMGHYGQENGKAMIFNNLEKLVQGDIIKINNDKNETLYFVVQRSQSFDPNANTSAIFNSNDGKAHLNLVTCGGVWNKITKNYSLRTVIFSDQE